MDAAQLADEAVISWLKCGIPEEAFKVDLFIVLIRSPTRFGNRWASW